MFSTAVTPFLSLFCRKYFKEQRYSVSGRNNRALNLLSAQSTQGRLLCTQHLAKPLNRTAIQVYPRVLFFRQPSILVRCCQRHRATFSRRNEQPHGLCLSCFGWGLQGPATLPPQRWALTPPFHPYRNAFGGLFLLHYPWSRLHRPLAGTLLCEARTFRFGRP